MAKKTYVLDLPSSKWVEFSGLDIISSCIMSGGETLDNVNLFLNTNGYSKMYPDDVNGVLTTETASIKKKIETYYSTFRNISVDSIDKSAGTITVTIENKIRNFNKVSNITASGNVNKEYGLALGSYGESIDVKLENFDKIKNILITLNTHRTRR